MQEEIIALCQKGDRTAQSRLYYLYADAMYNIACRMVNDDEEARDVLQMAFVDVFRNLHQFNGQSTIGAWIKRVVINRAITHLRLKQQDTEIFDLNLHNRAEENDDDHTPLLNIETVRYAIESLPDGYRIVLSLYLLEGYDHQEIASILKISESTSKTQYHRAKIKLRSILKTITVDHG